MKSPHAIWLVWVVFAHLGSAVLYWCWAPTTGTIQVVLRTDCVDLECRAATNGEITRWEAEPAGTTLLSFPPGCYELTARKPGHVPWRDQLEVEAGQTASREIELRPASPPPPPTSTLVVLAADCNVRCELKTAGGGPYSAVVANKRWELKLPVGTYTMVASKAAHKPYCAENLQVVADDSLTVVVPALEPLPGTLNLNVRPSGGEVRLMKDGAILPDFPRKADGILREELPPGKYQLIVSYDGYERYESTIVITSAQPTQHSVVLRLPSEGGKVSPPEPTPESDPESNVVLLLFATNSLATSPDLEPEIREVLHDLLAAKGSRIYGKRVWVVYRKGQLVGWDVAGPLTPNLKDREQLFHLQDSLSDAFLRGEDLALKQVSGPVVRGCELIYLWPSLYKPERYESGHGAKPTGWLLWLGVECDSPSPKILSEWFGDRWTDRRKPREAYDFLKQRVAKSPSSP